MDISKLTEGQFDAFKGKLSIDDFKTLDVNGDGYVSKEDADASDNAGVKSAIQELFKLVDEEPDVENFDLDDLNEPSTTTPDLGALAQANAETLVPNANGETPAASAESPEAAAGAGEAAGTEEAGAAQGAANAEAVSEVNAAANEQAAAVNETKAAGTLPNVPGYVDVDITNLDKKTEEELNDLLAKLNNNIVLLRARITELNNENTRLEGEIRKLEKDNADIRKDKGDLDKQIATKQLEVNEKQEKVEEAEKDLEVANNEYMLIQEELEKANDAILIEQGRAEGEYKEQIDIMTERIINQYDPDPNKDGPDFEKYFLRKMANADFVIFSNIDSLNDEALNLSNFAKTKLGAIKDQSYQVYLARTDWKKADNELTGLKTRAKSYDDLIAANDTKISQYRGQITANKSEAGSLESLITTNQNKKTKVEEALKVLNYNGKDILALISPEEKKLILDNKIDITKGYFIAQAKDGKWHVYDSNGTSVARKYGKKGSGLQGSDIIPSGSGYVNGKKPVSSGGKTVYYFSDVNADLTDGMQTSEQCTYSTSSPLSFDVNGDGIQTSSQSIMYDIDGNGTLDRINNSDEWVLAFDKDHNGIAGEDGSELFGDNTDLDGDGVKDGYANGFEALKALAQKEGLIGEGDNTLDEADLNKLSEKYGLTMTRGYGGEAHSLSELGISQINISTTSDTTLTKNFDGRHNDIMRQEGATFVVNGQTREYADIWNAKFTNPEVEPVKIDINENDVLALKGFIRTDDLLDEAKHTVPHSFKVRNKIEEYNKEQKEEEDKIAKEEEAKKEEEIAAETKKQEEEEQAKKVAEAKKAHKEE